jgi:hypothetical protein
MSSTIASSILRKFSAWRSSLEEKGIALILVTPSTICVDTLDRSQGVFDHVVEQARRDAHDIEALIRQDV